MILIKAIDLGQEYRKCSCGNGHLWWPLHKPIEKWPRPCDCVRKQSEMIQLACWSLLYCFSQERRGSRWFRTHSTQIGRCCSGSAPFHMLHPPLPASGFPFVIWAFFHISLSTHHFPFPERTNMHPPDFPDRAILRKTHKTHSLAPPQVLQTIFLTQISVSINRLSFKEGKQDTYQFVHFELRGKELEDFRFFVKGFNS